MRYLLDSDVVIDHLQGVRSIAASMGDTDGAEAFISMVTYMEVFQGVYRDSAREEKEAQLSEFLESIGIAVFSEHVARRCAIVREELRQGERRVRHRLLDLITAATALENDLTLVTRN